MGNFHARLIASPDQPAAEYWGVPELFVEPLNRYWLNQDGVILRVLLDEQYQTSREWSGLGQFLTTELFKSGSYAGLCFDGYPAFDDQVLGWLRAIRETAQQKRIAPGIVDLQWSLNPHAILACGTVNTTWISLQAVEDAEWLRSFWGEVDSEYFHHGCDLLMSAYPAAIPEVDSWGKPINIAVFLTTLERATGWIIPLDDNRGFLVGVTKDSALYRHLTSGA